MDLCLFGRQMFELFRFDRKKSEKLVAFELFFSSMKKSENHEEQRLDVVERN